MVHNKQDDESLLKFQCPAPDCSYKTMHKAYLREHSRVHSDARPFVCDLCPYRAKQGAAMRNHKKNVHSSEKPFKCQHLNCDYASKSKYHLIRHEKGHSDARPFVCSFPECTYTAKQKGYLKLHERTHTGEKPFKCSYCPYSCVDTSGLAVHSRIHTGEAPYPCKLCAFRGKSSGSLTVHVKRFHGGQKQKTKPRVYSDERPFACSFQDCPYKAKTKHMLDTHERSHRGEKPFKCTLCPFSSVVRSGLVVHIRSHTGETPYACDVCSYQGRSRTKLTRHVKSVHLGRRQSSKNKVNEGKMTSVRRPDLKHCKVESCTFATRDDSFLALHFNAAHKLPRVVLERQ